VDRSVVGGEKFREAGDNEGGFEGLVVGPNVGKGKKGAVEGGGNIESIEAR
jgi:hypothetical protein